MHDYFISAAVDASLGGANIRIAHRRIVTTSLKSCLAVDVSISSLDINLKAGLMVIAGGKVLYLWDLEHLTLIHKVMYRRCSTGNSSLLLIFNSSM
jgi:hypothetical protein